MGEPVLRSLNVTFNGAIPETELALKLAVGVAAIATEDTEIKHKRIRAVKRILCLVLIFFST